ncbi:MAG TPA: hypothetical protein VGG47_11100 [Acidocella sp.]
MGHDEVGLQAKGIFAGGNGVVELPEVLQSIAQIDMGFGKIRLQAQRIVVGGNRLVEAPQGLQGGAQVGVIGGDLWAYPDRLGNHPDGAVVLSGLMGEYAEQMQGVGMACIRRQHLTVEPLGLGPLPGSMVGKPGFQHLLRV